MGKEKGPYLREEPRQFSDPNKRMRPPFIMQLGFATHPSTATELGSALQSHGLNAWLTAHPQKESQKVLAAELEQAKYDAVHIYYRKKIASGEISEEKLVELLNRIPVTIFAEARGLIQLLENITVKNEPVQISGYSQGAPATLVAATLRPDLFPTKDDERSLIVLMNPAGITEKRQAEPGDAKSAADAVTHKRDKPILDLFGATWMQARYLGSVFGAALLRGAKGRQALADTVRYVAMQSSTDKEARDMYGTDMVPFINFLKSQIDVVVMYDEDDILFPSKKIEQRIPEMEGVQFLKTKGRGHFGPVHHPQETADDIQTILASRKKD